MIQYKSQCVDSEENVGVADRRDRIIKADVRRV